ncbi:MAG: hypothetical protein ACJ75T_00655 [Solirubrobacterales bacterium]
MNRLAQEAVLISLTRRLREQGSWAGETHLQKATYLVRELLEVPLDFSFILYKHGPFSFELRDELGSMQSDRLLTREAQPPPYGPRLATMPRGEELEERFERTMRKYGPRLDWIVGQIANCRVLELERLATALWVTRQQGEDASVQARAEALNKLKPHVSVEVATEAVQEVDFLIADAREQLDA